jgi:peroxiredoxin
MSAPLRVGRAGALAVVAAAVLLGYVLLNTLSSDGPGSQGLRVGARMPPFAAPLATSRMEGDVNVALRPGDRLAGARPACEVRGADVVNSCALAERGPVVLAFIATRGANCTGQLDVLERVRRRHPAVQVAAVAIRGDRDALRRLVRARGWGFPVAYDHDGVLANLYGVAVCPHLTLALRGGTVRETLIGEQGAAALDRSLTALERASRAQRRPGGPTALR